MKVTEVPNIVFPQGMGLHRFVQMTAGSALYMRFGKTTVAEVLGGLLKELDIATVPFPEFATRGFPNLPAPYGETHNLISAGICRVNLADGAAGERLVEVYRFPISENMKSYPEFTDTAYIRDPIHIGILETLNPRGVFPSDRHRIEIVSKF